MLRFNVFLVFILAVLNISSESSPDEGSSDKSSPDEGEPDEGSSDESLLDESSSETSNSNKKFSGIFPSDDELNEQISKGIDPYEDFIDKARKRTDESLKQNPNLYFENHHIIPKFEGGADDPTNLVRLSYNDHVLAHYIRWYVHRKQQDYVAFKVMSGQSEDARLSIAALGGRIGGPLAQQTHRKNKTGRFDSEAQSKRGKKGAEVNRLQGTGAYDPENLKRANAALQKNPEAYLDQKIANLEKGRATQREKGVGIGDPDQQRLKSLMRVGYIELDGKKYSICTEHRIYVCETTLAYYLRYAPRRGK